MKTKIKVPKGMLEAVVKSRAGYLGADPFGIDPLTYSTVCVQGILEAALEWLAEHPAVPSYAQLQQIERATGMGNSLTPERAANWCRGFAKWQSMMFLAPEPNPLVDIVKNALRGARLTRAEADEISDHVAYCYRQWCASQGSSEQISAQKPKEGE